MEERVELQIIPSLWIVCWKQGIWNYIFTLLSVRSINSFSTRKSNVLNSTKADTSITNCIKFNKGNTTATRDNTQFAESRIRLENGKKNFLGNIGRKVEQKKFVVGRIVIKTALMVIRSKKTYSSSTTSITFTFFFGNFISIGDKCTLCICKAAFSL